MVVRMAGIDLLAELDTEAGYRRRFYDAVFWAPYVLSVCARHGLRFSEPVRSGLPGTCPTFIAGERWVVKFFGRLFDGERGFETEREVNRLLARSSVMPVPTVLAHGDLVEDVELPAWRWPYLVFEFIPGINIGEVFEQISLDDRLQLARDLGAMTRRLHGVSLVGSHLFQSDWWGSYLGFLHEQRRCCADRLLAAGALPQHLAVQVAAFLSTSETAISPAVSPHLIHADLTRDHILGVLEAGHWTTGGIIDFGDAMVGELAYELVALHVDLFGCDRRLLRVYLDAYGLECSLRWRLPLIAMRATLLHRFSTFCLRAIFEVMPAAREATALDDLAALIWDVEAPDAK